MYQHVSKLQKRRHLAHPTSFWRVAQTLDHIPERFNTSTFSIPLELFVLRLQPEDHDPGY